MAAVTISSERAGAVDAIVRNFVSTFAVPPLKSKEGIEAFTSVYHPEVEWYDHAFHICRKGHDALLGLQRGFAHCNVPFRVDIKSIVPTTDGAVLEQVWVGRSTNDIVRPDGQVAVKASGRDFECHVCMLIAIDAAGKVTRIDEYYNKLWDQGIREESYVVVK